MNKEALALLAGDFDRARQDMLLEFAALAQFDPAAALNEINATLFAMGTMAHIAKTQRK